MTWEFIPTRNSNCTCRKYPPRKPRREHVGGNLREPCEMGAKREGLFADKLTAQDAYLAAKRHIPRVQNFHFGSAFYQQQFFARHQKRNPQIVLGQFAIAHLAENFLRDRQPYVVAARIIAGRGHLPDPCGAGVSLSGDTRIAGSNRRGSLHCRVRMDPFHSSDETITSTR